MPRPRDPLPYASRPPPEVRRTIAILLWRRSQIAAFDQAVHEECWRHVMEIGTNHASEQEWIDATERVIAAGHPRPPQDWFDQEETIRQMLSERANDFPD